MPDKLTDSEIVKMLECCKQEIDDNGVICGECKKCPNYEGKTGLCKEDLPTVALDLINRLNEKLETFESRNKALRTERNRLNKRIKDLQAEIDNFDEGKGLILTIDGAEGYFPIDFIKEAIKTHTRNADNRNGG